MKDRVGGRRGDKLSRFAFPAEWLPCFPIGRFRESVIPKEVRRGSDVWLQFWDTTGVAEESGAVE